MKKVLAMVLALTMVLGVFGVSTYAYTDVAEDAAYAEAVAVLSALDILKGFPDDVFKPEDTITRAEFSAVVCRALGLEGAAAGAVGATQFTDVPADHWASGYINMATQQGIILGYGDGTFGPNDPVLYEQAVKMIVAALGYTPKADANGGYPSGYLVVAAQEKVLEGTEELNAKAGVAATRGLVAQLAYNSLDVVLMVQTKYGDSPEFAADPAGSTFLSKLRVSKVEGIVTDNDYNDITKAKKVAVVNGKDAYIGETDIADYLGYYVTAYYKTVNSERTWVAVAAKASKNNAVTVEKDIVGKVAGNFEYWANKDTDDETTKLKLATGYKVFYNGAAPTVASAVVTNINPTQGAVTFVDNNNDDYFEYVFITDYKTIVVDSVTTKGRVSDKNGNASIEFDAESTSYIYTIYDEEGNVIEPADLAEYDILAVLATDDNKVKIAYKSNAKIEGKVTEVDTNNGYYYIDGEAYEAIGGVSLALEDEGTFYINAFGKIAYVDATSVSGDYAFLYAVAPTTGISKTVQYRMMTEDGNWATYDSYKKVTIGGSTYDPSTTAGANAIVSALTAKSLVSYKLDAEGKVKAIAPAAFDVAAATRTFNADTGMFGAFDVADAKIMSVATTVAGEEDVEMITADTFQDKENYSVAFINDVQGDVRLVVAYGVTGTIKNDSTLFVVKSIGDVTVDGDTVKKLRGYVVGSPDELNEGEGVIALTGSDLTVTKVVYDAVYGNYKEVSGSINSLKAGSVIQYITNTKGQITKARVLYETANYASIVAAGYTDLCDFVVPGQTTKTQFIFGEVVKKANNKLTLGVGDPRVSGIQATFNTAKADYSLVDRSTGSVRVTGESMFGDVISATFDVNNAKVEAGSFVLIRVYDDVPAEVIIIK